MRKLVQAHGESLLLVTVVLLDDLQVLGESLQTLNELLAIIEVQVVLLHVLIEQLLFHQQHEDKKKRVSTQKSTEQRVLFSGTISSTYLDLLTGRGSRNDHA